jgi:hypothetical protein
VKHDAAADIVKVVTQVSVMAFDGEFPKRL